MFNKKKKDEDTFDPSPEDIGVENSETTDRETAESENEAEEAAPEVTAEEKLQQDNAALNDKYLRLFAEFDNYKRRTQKERMELLQTAGKDVIVSLLPVLDDFDRAIKATETATEISAVREGIILVQNKLKNIMSGKGLKEIESADKDFDTDVHEAVTNIPAPDASLKGKVIDTLEKGYTLNDKVIRFAKVVVGN